METRANRHGLSLYHLLLQFLQHNSKNQTIANLQAINRVEELNGVDLDHMGNLIGGEPTSWEFVVSYAQAEVNAQAN